MRPSLPSASLILNALISAILGQKRRARDSNPQPLAGHLISNQTPHHSDTLRDQMYRWVY